MAWLKKKLSMLKAQFLPDHYYLKKIFIKHVGYKLNIEKPRTFNEKMQWLKLNYRIPILTSCADKFAVRDYIASIIGEAHLIPLVYVTDDPENLRNFEFPDFPCIVKSNHDSGGYHIIKNPQYFDMEKLIDDAKSWLRSNHYLKTKEWQYKNIKPKIIIEKLLIDENNSIPNDVKFSCINGRAEMVHIDSNKEIKHLRNNYNRDFEPLAINWPEEYERNEYIPMPNNFFEARDLAEKLSKPFPFVRVDFYLVGNKIFFGELTFHPTSGFGRFSPEYYDFKFGSKLKLPSEKLS